MSTGDSPEAKVEPRQPPPGRKFPCPACGAKLDFDPKQQSLACPYCGHTEEVRPHEGYVEEHDYDTYLEKIAEEKTTIAGRSTEVRCTGCGAIVLLEDKIATDRCPFCTTHLENAPQSAEAMIPPESVLPFKIDSAKARAAFSAWLETLWFAPTSLRLLANLGQITGIYIPYWTYDSMTYSRYNGQRGIDRHVHQTYTERDAQGNLVTRTRTIVVTDWFPVSGEVEHFFDDVLICASKSMPIDKVNQLQPWDLPDLTPFKSEYLSGFTTERYAVGLEEGFASARGIMDSKIRQLCLRDIGGDHQRLGQVWTKHRGVTFKHLLLPIWLAAYRYHDKLFRIFVNARTGEVVGDRPYSTWKIIGAVLAGILAAVLIIGGIMALNR